MNEALFSVGDIIRIKSYETLVDEFGINIDIPSVFVPEMKEYCGKEFEIRERWRRTDNKYAYYLSGILYAWDECVLVPQEPLEEINVDNFEISFDSVMAGTR